MGQTQGFDDQRSRDYTTQLLPVSFLDDRRYPPCENKPEPAQDLDDPLWSSALLPGAFVVSVGLLSRRQCFSLFATRPFFSLFFRARSFSFCLYWNFWACDFLFCTKQGVESKRTVVMNAEHQHVTTPPSPPSLPHFFHRLLALATHLSLPPSPPSDARGR